MSHGNAFRSHAVKRDVHRVKVGRKFWLFTFSDQWGPSLCDEWAEPVNNMPLADEEHPFWDAFEPWLKARDLKSPSRALLSPAVGVEGLSSASPQSDHSEPRGALPTNDGSGHD